MTKKAGTDVVSMKDMEDMMALQVSDATARIHQPTGNVIGIRNSRFTYKQEVIEGDLEIIVLDFIHQRVWYDAKFDPDNPAPPACFSQSADGDEMQPHNSSPSKQADYCDGCPMDAWGTATTGSGEGKACREQYRLAVLEPTDDPAEGDIALLTLPPSSLKNWDKYVRELGKLKRPPNSVLTIVSFDTSVDFPLLDFSVEQEIKKPEYYKGICDRMEEARSAVMDPLDVSNYEPPSAKKKVKKKAASKKRPAKKKAAGKRKF